MEMDPGPMIYTNINTLFNLYILMDWISYIGNRTEEKFLNFQAMSLLKDQMSS